jgi:hypothetical protein
MREELILISEDSPNTRATIPSDDRSSKTVVARIEYEVLSENPYTHSRRDFFKLAHHDIRRKTHLKIDSYLLARSLLVRQFGWGIHVDSNGKLALMPSESEEYGRLLNDPEVKNTRA